MRWLQEACATAKGVFFNLSRAVGEKPDGMEETMATVQFDAELNITDPYHTEFVQLFLKLLRKLEEELELRGLVGRIAERKSCWVADVTWQGQKLPVLNHASLVAKNQDDIYILCDPWGWSPTPYVRLEKIFLVYCDWVLKLAKERRRRDERLIGKLEPVLDK